MQSLHRIAGTALVAVLCAGSFPTLTWAQASAEENKETLYAIGVLVARQLVPLKLSEAELSEVTRGLGDAALGRPLATQPEKIREQINAFTGSRQRAAAAAESAAATKFMEDAAAAEGAVQTESGLIYIEQTAGTGASPQASDTVEVHYHGTLRDGTVFDSSVDRGTPAKFPLDRVIPCWTEGLQRMKVGGKSRLVCPSSVAYGEKGAPGIPAGAALSFEVELLGIAAPQ